MTTLTIIGNLTESPELRFIQSGAAVVNFTVAENMRKFDKAKNEWVDGETNYWRCSLWREQAESVAESLTKGTRVIVVGEVKSRTWDKDGQTRTEKEIEVTEIGPSLKYATVKVTKTDRKSLGGTFATPPAADDPWASSDVPF